MTALVPSFLNGSSSSLRVTWTTIKARMSLNFCQIQQLTTELATLECLKKIDVSTFSPILFKLAEKEEMHNILDVVSLDNRQHKNLPLTIQKIPKLGYNGEKGILSCFFFWLFSYLRTISFFGCFLT